ncbi:MAG: hypothetical protein ACKV2V_25035 [Blastocatellia bacterium]
MKPQESLYSAYLNQHDDAAWDQVLNNLMSAVHPVDRRALRIWFSFFPLRLHRALSAAPDPAKIERDLILQGTWRLADQIDSSAHFLYGHRYWPQVRAAVTASTAASPASLALDEQILEVAGKAAATCKADKSLLVAITAVAFMTLQQVGPELFARPAAPVSPKSNKTPKQILRDRSADASQGMLGFLRSVDKRFTITFDENDPAATFTATNSQDLTMAAETDKRPWHLKDNRCKEGEGPIPVECRTAACGTCWIGVLSDASKVAAPTSREIERVNKTFCYSGFTGTQDSPIRMACQTRVAGNVSLVIPPWNGLLWKLNKKEPGE